MKMNRTTWYAVAMMMGLVASAFFAAAQQRATEGLWYKESIIYSLEVGTFKDSDGDGIGDFQGLIQKLGYLDSLGIDAIWLAPFNPSPGWDDGYDVTDYYTVNPKYGTMDDFRQFIAEAKKRKIRVISDVVLNHTSIKHPWYESARQDPQSPYRKWYVWAEELPDDADKGMVFPGVQQTTWSYDSLANLYYFHRFYPFQPDLNYTNPEVQQKAFDILEFWLRQGMDGYRLDAVPFIIDVPETGSDKPVRMMELVPTMRNVMRGVKHDALMLGEANLAPEENKDYFGEDNSGMQMMFNFYVNQFLFYALAIQDVRPLAKAMQATKEKPETAQWAYFLRNHDEIDLDRLGKRRREKVYAQFGPDTSMQLYDRGIRRRLAPMLSNPDQLRMAYSLLFALPGTPVIRYGEEIGMGDDLSLKERLAVRTPMQWSAAPHGGFTTGDTAFRKVIDNEIYGYRRVNVQRQLADSASLLNHIKRLINIRKVYPQIGSGDFAILNTGSKHVVAMLYQGGDQALLTVHNFANKPQEFRLNEKSIAGKPLHDLLLPGRPSTKGGERMKLPAFGFAWYRIP